MRKHIEPYSGYLLVALILLSGCSERPTANDDAGVIGASLVLGMCAGIVGLKLDGSDAGLVLKGAAFCMFSGAALLILGGA